MQNSGNQACYEYAGFWARFAAYMVDGIILMAGFGIIDFLMLGVMAMLKDTPLGGEILFQYTLKDIIKFLAESAYFVLFTYFTGATLGKQLMKLKVISVKGEEKVSLLDVIYREVIGKYLSGILGIGYIMAGFTQEKKALHDILCDTRVVQVKKYVEAPKAVEKTEENVEEAPAVDMVPKMVEEQWKMILNPQKEEENTEGNS